MIELYLGYGGSAQGFSDDGTRTGIVLGLIAGALILALYYARGKL